MAVWLELDGSHPTGYRLVSDDPACPAQEGAVPPLDERLFRGTRSTRDEATHEPVTGPDLAPTEHMDETVRGCVESDGTLCLEIFEAGVWHEYPNLGNWCIYEWSPNEWYAYGAMVLEDAGDGTMTLWYADEYVPEQGPPPSANPLWIPVGGSGGGGSGGGASGFTFSQDTAPTATAVGQTWFETDTGNSYVWTDDGTSTQWVQFAPGGGGGSGGSGFTFVRDTAPTPTKVGDTWFDLSTAATGGTSWVAVEEAPGGEKVWVQFAPGSAASSAPRGVLRSIASNNGGDQAVGGSEVVLCSTAPLTHTVTVQANRWTRWTMSLSGIAAAAGGQFAVILYIDGGVNHIWRRPSFNTGHVVETLVSRPVQLAAGTHTITFGVVAYTQNYTVAAWNYQAVFVTAEDIGPVI